MTKFIGVLGLLIFLLLAMQVASRLLNRRGAKDGRPPFRKRGSVMTENERAFFHTLCRAVPSGHFVFANMRLIDLLDVQARGKEAFAWKNRVRQKHIDFVVCEPVKLEPIVAIELDGQTHAKEAQARRDRMKDACLEAAGLPLLRIKARSDGYSVNELRGYVTTAINPTAIADREPSEKR